ncbi:hypothetical protein, conserved [Eimeria tenella]|uniref:Uncharacterized protein n=1 Tax=Eimeria tenella TaxID=5802 RepID=U6KUQ1_EIMTE|nr:hypothetical protein, conserved [Eimeria tenella]CDJ39230.1 hypothetical protein, conserved [Eimeria tenella]|eukprot:XP_013229985.1 hypothetical protein, conserved [Eimeria tenella]
MAAESKRNEEADQQTQNLVLPTRRCSNLYSETELTKVLAEYISDVRV